MCQIAGCFEAFCAEEPKWRSAREPGDEGEGEGEEEEEEGAEKAAAAESSVAMALFCLHFMYRIAVTEQCRLSCKLELERNLIAEWGTGVALRRIADGAPM